MENIALDPNKKRVVLPAFVSGTSQTAQEVNYTAEEQNATGYGATGMQVPPSAEQRREAAGKALQWLKTAKAAS